MYLKAVLYAVKYRNFFHDSQDYIFTSTGVFSDFGGTFPFCGLQPQSCLWCFIFCPLVRTILFQGELNPFVPEKRDWERKARVRIFQGHFWCFFFRAGEPLTRLRQVQFLTGCQELPVFLNTCETYKQRKMFPDIPVLSGGNSFLRSYLSVSNGPSVICGRYLLRMDC